MVNGQPKAEAPITTISMSGFASEVFHNIPLDADAYYISADLSAEELDHVRKAWERMNSSLPKKKVLIVTPVDIDLKPLPTAVIWDWMAKCAGVLKERGEL